MFNFYRECEFTSGGTFNWVAFLAVIVSLFSVCCSLYFVYLTKRMEVINHKFQKFCINSIDNLFKPIDDKFNSKAIKFNKKRQLITDTFVEIQLFITALRKVYPTIPIEEIVIDIESFTDKLYVTSEIDPIQLKSDYLSTKFLLYNKLYNFALKQELSLFYKIGLKKVL